MLTTYAELVADAEVEKNYTDHQAVTADPIAINLSIVEQRITRSY